MPNERAVIIGAGPAGLTAAFELQQQSSIQPVVLESSQEIGGLSRTVRYKAHRMDIGGHRFFSKSERVMDWWLEQMPLQQEVSGVASQDRDPSHCMLVRPRQSRIYYLRRLFDYPIALTWSTLSRLGVLRTARILISFLAARVRFRRAATSLEEFLIQRFGRQLYLTFFKSYTEKVWGAPCRQISADWGMQRIKELSLSSAMRHWVRRTLRRSNASEADIHQKGTSTSLIERFLYPTHGPGQLWEHVASRVTQNGGVLHLDETVVAMYEASGRITAVETEMSCGKRTLHSAEHFLCSMPVRELIQAMQRGGIVVPSRVAEVSNGLVYRDFLTIGLLVDRLALCERDGTPLKDNWIYIQEPNVVLGRLQIFNNWSPYLTQSGKVWIGLEYFCNETDPIWKMSDEDLMRFGAEELASIGILPSAAFQDGHVVRVPKAYPAYFGSYCEFGTVRSFTDSFHNLYLIGRNGMHQYNNQDHSMLTAMRSVENIVQGISTKDNIWSVNAEKSYQEEKPTPRPIRVAPSQRPCSVTAAE